MNVSFELAYLENADGAGIAEIGSMVWTVVPASLAEEHPQLHRFQSQ
ncbi:hypothetical protein [Halomonas sp. KAO]|nr:hypothetical protein [Halomonas sp. KAO]